MFLERFDDAAMHPAWRFREKTGKEETVTPVAVSIDTRICGAFAVTRTAYSVPGGRAIRFLATDKKHISALVEWVSLDAPRSLYTSFFIPANKDLNCNVANKNRLVLRSEENGAKLFRLFGTVDGADFMEGSGLLLPDGFSNDMMRITPYSGLYGFGCRHLSAFAMTEDLSDCIKGWHMEGGVKTEITAPDKTCLARIELNEECVTFTDVRSETNITFFMNEGNSI